MKKRIAAAAAAMLLVVPLAAGAADIKTRLQVEGEFSALQKGRNIFVHDGKRQLFQTNGRYHDGELVDLFVLPYGPQQIPFILVNHDNSGILYVFSDLWPEFAKGKEKDQVEEYYSGRVFTRPQKKIWSKTKHHYAEMQGGEAVAYTANDFGDIKKGYHESIRVKGKLRGLVLYDCCPYLVIEGADGKLAVYHAGMEGAEAAGKIDAP